jgi:pantoate--beta-alanine ligase
MQVWSRRQRRAGKIIGFVPTMGALHEGHLSLVRASKKRADRTVVSIFVNPTQFSPKEDLKKYPRPFRRDCAMCRAEGVDVIFAPTVKEMYPGGYRTAGKNSAVGSQKPESAAAFSTYVDELKLAQVLEGASRPGFFRGVCTVVAKLFNCVQPDFAFFGQKDAQQLAVIRRMVRDLNFPIRIIACPIVREPDGLAMSSRNVYLSPDERKGALVLKKSLDWATKQVANGELRVESLSKGIKKIIATAPTARVDYIAFVDEDTFAQLQTVRRGQTLIALAVLIGKTRLIDNTKL